MATQTRTQRMQVVTPKGTAGFCFLDRPSTKRRRPAIKRPKTTEPAINPNSFIKST